MTTKMFVCTHKPTVLPSEDADKMNYKEMADSVRHFKEDKEGWNIRKCYRRMLD